MCNRAFSAIKHADHQIVSTLLPSKLPELPRNFFYYLLNGKEHPGFQMVSEGDFS